MHLTGNLINPANKRPSDSLHGMHVAMMRKGHRDSHRTSLPDICHRQDHNMMPLCTALCSLLDCSHSSVHSQDKHLGLCAGCNEARAVSKLKHACMHMMCDLPICRLSSAAARTHSSRKLLAN